MENIYLKQEYRDLFNMISDYNEEIYEKFYHIYLLEKSDSLHKMELYFLKLCQYLYTHQLKKNSKQTSLNLHSIQEAKSYLSDVQESSNVSHFFEIMNQEIEEHTEFIKDMNLLIPYTFSRSSEREDFRHVYLIYAGLDIVSQLSFYDTVYMRSYLVQTMLADCEVLSSTSYPLFANYQGHSMENQLVREGIKTLKKSYNISF